MVTCIFFSNLWGAFLCYVWYSLAYLAARPAASQTWKHLKNPLVFIGPKPYAPFSRNTRSDHISEDRRSKNRPKINAPKRPHETRHNEQKNTILDVKIVHFWSQKSLPKTTWTPRARARTHRESKNRFGSALGQPPGRKKNFGNFQKRPGKIFGPPRGRQVPVTEPPRAYSWAAGEG